LEQVAAWDMSWCKWLKMLEPVSSEFAGTTSHFASSSYTALTPHDSTANGQFVKDCGADIILFYDGGPNFDFADALNGRPIDVVIDCVGGDQYFQSACRCAYPLGAHRGRFITIVGPEPDAAKISYASAIFKFATR
jgi:NADPH:quinone reductase-like Zn-dependent oxidoreductase